jgi:N-acetylmuramoyl-L-alanine amidase
MANVATKPRRDWVARLFALLAVLLTACAPLRERATIPTQWQPSQNFDERRFNFVIMHYTGDTTVVQALRTLTDPLREVSSHYLVGRDGSILQLVDERARAWHAGESQWGSNTDLNSSSLGIELDNDGNEPFPEAQITALLALLNDIQQRYHLPSANFLGHADVAPRRKVDPGQYFPWKTLAQHGFGLWCNSPLTEAPATFDAIVALQLLGYDISDVDAAVRAFKTHFVQKDTAAALTDYDRGVLHCLLGQKFGRKR